MTDEYFERLIAILERIAVATEQDVQARLAEQDEARRLAEEQAAYLREAVATQKAADSRSKEYHKAWVNKRPGWLRSLFG